MIKNTSTDAQRGATTGEHSTPTSEKQEPSANVVGQYPTPDELTAADADSILESINNGSDRKINWCRDRRNEAPLDGLSGNVIDLIAGLCTARKVPTDFYVAPIIAAVSIAAGSHIKVSGAGFTNMLNVFAAVVAPSGSNKSTPAKEIIRPLEDINKELIYQSKRELEAYEAAKEARAKSKDKELPLPAQPKERQLIVTNITEESRIKVLTDNPHGILQYNDELQTFLANLGKYTNTNEQGSIMSIWNADSNSTNRIGRGVTHLDKPFFSLFGTIQPHIATQKLTSQDSYDSGFAQRFLVFAPQDINFYNLSTEADSFLVKWSSWITTIYKSSADRLLTPSAEAYNVYMSWYNEASQIQTITNNDTERSLIGKLKIYIWKLAGIAHVINEAAEARTSDTIYPSEMIWAASICKYSFNSHISLMNPEADMNPDKMLHEAIVAILKARPTINQSELAKVLGTNPERIRKIKSRIYQK